MRELFRYWAAQGYLARIRSRRKALLTLFTEFDYRMGLGVSWNPNVNILFQSDSVINSTIVVAMWGQRANMVGFLLVFPWLSLFQSILHILLSFKSKCISRLYFNFNNHVGWNAVAETGTLNLLWRGQLHSPSHYSTSPKFRVHILQTGLLYITS